MYAHKQVLHGYSSCEPQFITLGVQFSLFEAMAVLKLYREPCVATVPTYSLSLKGPASELTI